MNNLKYAVVVVVLMLVGFVRPAMTAEYMEKNDFQKKFAFSPGVITKGGRIVWLAGVTALRDESGKDISGQFEPQVRVIFNDIDKQLKKAGGNLTNVVTMTIYVTDPRYIERFAELRREMFKDGNYPASTFIAVSNLPIPGLLVEIQGTAVIGED